MSSSHNKLYKTLLESFSDFNITEDDKKDKPTSRTATHIFPVRDIFGGGNILHTIEIDTNDIMISYSDTFVDKFNKTLVKHEFKNKTHTLHDQQNPEGQSFHSGTTFAEINNEFLDMSAKIMMNHYERQLSSTDIDGNRTLSIIKNIGGFMKENSQTGVNVNKLIYDELKDFIELSNWTAANIGKKITKLPPGMKWDTIQEDKKDKPTKTKDKPKVDDIFKQKPDQPVVPKDDDKDDVKGNDKPKMRIGDPIRPLTPTDDIASMLSRMRDIEADEEPDDPPRNVVARRVTPENLPAVISGDMINAGFQNPEWYTVATLPGNYGRSIRQLGKMLFRSFTRTPTNEIVVIANVGGQGPNTSLEINSVASWLRNNGREITGGDIDFSNIMPGYQADIKQYSTGNARFLLVRDDYGHYIYTWPEQDTIQ